ncbi:MAG: hypothetical protein ACYSU0_22060, partial [Planctomycetota bacterium]
MKSNASSAAIFVAVAVLGTGCAETHWGEPAGGLRLGIAINPKPHLLLAGVGSQQVVRPRLYLRNESLALPPDCDGTVRIASWHVALRPAAAGGGFGVRHPRPAGARLYRRLLDGSTRRLAWLESGALLGELLLAVDPVAYAEGTGDRLVETSVEVAATLVLH